jgi:hypothetical protein
MKPDIERLERMFEAVIRGSTFKAAGEREGRSTERARQAVYKIRMILLHPKRLGTDIKVPDGDYWKAKELRAHADFWLAQLAKWRAERSRKELPGP